MSPIFGHKSEEQQEQQTTEEWEQALKAECARLDVLPLPQLATEVITTEYGRPDADPAEFTVAGGNVHAGPNVYGITKRLMATRGIDFRIGPMKNRELQEAIIRLVAEALQHLEHASLVRVQVHYPAQAGPDYAITRRGRAALELGQVEALLSTASA